MSVVVVDGVSKRYFDGGARVWAVRNVSCAIEKGTLTILQGPSGSGKTTLLGLMGGLVTPTQGNVELMGKSIARMRDHHRTRWRREHVGVVFQDLALLRGMSLLENVLLPLVPDGGARKEDVSRAESLLERFGLGAKRDARVETLSGGEQQRGALARAFLRSPSVLLLDEPTAHVDAANAERIVAQVATLRDEGHAIVASTHDPRLSDDRRVDRVIRLRGGTTEAGEEE
ncbi:MAG: ABC transporter ATP-binding protein [Myxococcota bacterium]